MGWLGTCPTSPNTGSSISKDSSNHSKGKRDLKDATAAVKCSGKEVTQLPVLLKAHWPEIVTWPLNTRDPEVQSVLA